MKSSLSFVVPSAIAILSTTLLCGLSGTAVSQTATGAAVLLPSTTVVAPKQSGEATGAGAGGNSCILPHSANPSNATASARFSTSEDCQA
jgi:hypothetical protein